MLHSRSFSAVAVAALMAGSCTVGRAQTKVAQSRSSYSDRPPDTLLYDHLNGRLERRDRRGHRGQTLERWDGATLQLLRVPPDRPLVIVVKNANSLLYEYEVSVDVATKRDLESCRVVGARFAMQSLVTGANVATGLAAPTAVGTQLLASVAARANAASGARGPSLLSEQPVSGESMERALSGIRPRVTAYIDFAAAFARLAASLKDSLPVVAERGEYLRLDSLLAAMQQQAESVLRRASQPGLIPQMLQAKRDDLQPDVDTLRRLVDVVLLRRYEGGPGDSAATHVRELSRRLERSYRPLQQALRRIEVAKAGTRQTFVLGASPDVRKVTIALKPTSEFPDVPRLRSGGVEMFVEPRALVFCELTAGVAWLERPPSYTVTNGLVVNEAASGQRSSVLLGLRVVWPGFRLVGLFGAVGLGDDSRPDFFAGLSVRLFAVVRANGGWAWQSEQQLPAGLQEGGAAPPAGLGRLTRRYRSGPFWGVTFSL